MDTRIAHDRRRARAQAMTGFVLNALEPWVDRLQCLEDRAASIEKDDSYQRSPEDHRRSIRRALFDLFSAVGVEVITDADRALAGLDPRNHLGLTEFEMQTMENRLREAMLRPAPPMIFPS